VNQSTVPTQTRSVRQRDYLQSDSGLELWREAMQQLRHLNDDVWKTFALYLSLNIPLLLVIIALLACAPHFIGGFVALLTVLIALAGLLLTVAGHYLFKRHRIYYLQMLAKKTLLEMDLGLYESRLANSQMDLAFPWRLTPEVAAEIARDPATWINKSVRSPGTMARIQFWILEAVLATYSIVLFFGIYILFIR
jgi:hypothetical protein